MVSEYIGHEFIPTIVDQDGWVHLADQDEAAEILNRIQAVSEGLQ